MRIRQLQLLKYGKFDGTSLDFPSNTAGDFHVVVGPNEAGKSTVRNAITELLFGMPLRTRLDFRHALAEMRLGGVLQGVPGELAFHRARGRTPLRTPADAVMPDTQLAPFLGTADKDFFEQMFCMDHDQLVEGGRSILDSSKDVGRVLFQSAAGIASLGPVREALEKQAGNLWAPRKGSSDYALAAQRFDEAQAELKSAQVKTKVWTEAKAALDTVLADIATEEQRRLALEASRSRLERVRRLGPRLLEIRRLETAWAEPGEVIDFPATALAELQAGGQALSAAEALCQARARDVEARRGERGEVSFDPAVLALRADIEALDRMRSLCANHPRDLPLREAEVDRLLDEARAAAAQLGWPAGESDIRAGRPSALALQAVGNLLRDRGGLHQALRGAHEAVRQKTLERDGLRQELQALPSAEVSPALRQALADALALGNSPARQRTLAAAVDTAQARLAQALAALGAWRVPVDALRAMALPSLARLTALQRQRHDAASAVAHARDRHADLQAQAERHALALRHFEQAHAVVTPEQVRAAREGRDAAWASVKGGEIALHEGAPPLDAAIRRADELVDAQLGSATEVATLQSTRQNLALAEAERARQHTVLAERMTALATLDADWAALARSVGWADMPLDDAAQGLAQRDEALAAHDEAALRQRERDAEAAACRDAQAALAAPLQDAGVDVPPSLTLPALCAQAGLQVSQADGTQARRSGLVQQGTQAQRALDALQAHADAATDQYRQWEAQWAAALRSARLEGASATFAEAEGAVALAQQVTERLDRADQIRRERIDTMRADLDRLEAEARRLGAAVEPQGPALAFGDGPEVAWRLAQRLRDTVTAAQQAALAEDALRKAQSERDAAELQRDTVRAQLKPLLALAGVASVAEAIPLVEKSDRRRALRRDLDDAREALIRDGDGLERTAIEAEVAAQDPADVAGLGEQAKGELADVAERLAALVRQRVTAEQALAAIAGQANAAIAEAKRQEALAAMGDVAEQYLEVATAGKLLKWAIDRYRDRQQGPMLQRASTVFAELTLGDFVKLGVDYEKDTPALYARRRGGPVVEVAGLSEGTRDQLYLALRIAALELHLVSAPPLPFVADDLFVNFDDARAQAGLRVLRALSAHTQVVFLTHHAHLLPLVREVFPEGVNVVELARDAA
ncbi:AAA family ATPase [Variovorax sp. LT1R16]|uniref:ATP-binding protein n=1 Tax=Variovorax sp. LT1R16 TaxID=3443728 RepID=UPI003F456759